MLLLTNKGMDGWGNMVHKIQHPMHTGFHGTFHFLNRMNAIESCCLFQHMLWIEESNKIPNSDIIIKISWQKSCNNL